MKTSLYILIIGVVITLSSPFIFTRDTVFDKLDFSQTGQIGDTIGGITAPIVNLIGAVLVFYALKAQIEENMLIQSQFDEQKNSEIINKNNTYISDLYNYLQNNIDNFTYNDEKRTLRDFPNQFVSYKGIVAIKEYLKNLALQGFGNPHNDKQILNNGPTSQFYFLLESLDFLIVKLNVLEISDLDKEFYIRAIKNHFKYSLTVQYNPENYGKFKLCEICGEQHDRFPIIIKKKLSVIENKLENI